MDENSKSGHVKIFVSWAKPQGRKLAEALKETILKMDGVDVFVSSEDIAFGSEWFAVLKENLKGADRALVCVTHDAIESAWVFFEMGALWALLNNVGVLVFGLDKDELQDTPLQQIQWARGDSKDAVARLLAEFVETQDPERVRQHVEDSWAAWTARIQAITEPLAEAEVDETVSSLGVAVIKALQRTRLKEFEFRLYSEVATKDLAKQRLPFDLVLNGLLKVRSDRPRIRSYGEVSLLIRVVLPEVLSFSHIEQVVLGARTALSAGIKVTDNVRHDPWDTFVFLAGTHFDIELAGDSKHKGKERIFVIGGENYRHTDYINLFLLAVEGEPRFLNMSPHAWMDPVLEAITFRWPQEG